MVVLSDDGNDEKNYAVLKSLAFKVIDVLGRDAEFDALVGALKDLADQHHVPHDGPRAGAAMGLALSARRLRPWVH